jgi:hypothetical protein
MNTILRHAALNLARTRPEFREALREQLRASNSRLAVRVPMKKEIIDKSRAAAEILFHARGQRQGIRLYQDLLQDWLDTYALGMSDVPTEFENKIREVKNATYELDHAIGDVAHRMEALARDIERYKGDWRPRVYASEKEALGRLPMERRHFLPPAARDKAPLEPDGTDLQIWTWESGGAIYGIAFAGKANKPLWHLRFMSEGRRDQMIKETIESRKRSIETKLQRMKERKEFQHDYKVGDILDSSWGYDQTNHDFYVVTKVIGKQIEIREVAKKVVREERTAEYVVPVPAHFVGPPMRKTPQKGGYVRLTSYSSASKWDGKPKYQTAFGYGH